jgi:hypothetical protein
MKRQMLFIESTAVQVHIFSQFTLPRLGTFILAGLVNRRSNWSARVFIEGQRRFDLDAWIAGHGRPDVVGISTITATAKRGFASPTNAALEAYRSSSAAPCHVSCQTRRWRMPNWSSAEKAKPP